MTPLHFKKFNDKVQLMNQSHSKDLKLSSNEARSLHHDIFDMLEELNSYRKNSKEEPVQVILDPGQNSL